MENPLTLTVNSTHYYLIGCRGGKLLVDAGWDLAKFANRLKAYQVPFSAIQYVMFTHHHPDHAGLVQNIKDLSGAKLIIHQKQLPFLADLSRYYEKKGGYEPIRVEKDDLVSPDRAALESIGIQGEIVETPGHSDDSVSLVLDNGAAFIGDLPWPEYASPENASTVLESWEKLLSRGAKVFYHSHTGPIPAERIKPLLSG
jgi:glyoxylase-like metal-dependent hydrolase (beta-lactamase superfamily II)